MGEEVECVNVLVYMVFIKFFCVYYFYELIFCFGDIFYS